MAIIRKIRQYFQGKGNEKDAAPAYDLWAPAYDNQPDNLMLHLDESVFSELLEKLSLQNKVVIDIGCGTGRHWKRIFEQKPQQLVGYDVSSGMLMELKKKFPEAAVQLATDDQLSGVLDRSVDVIISTLTLAHIQNLEASFAAWARVLKSTGHMLLTDFHPVVLAIGGKRNFTSGGKQIVIRNYVHKLDTLKKIAEQHQLQLIHQTERYLDDSVRHFYEKQNALAVYEQYRGMPIIYGLYLHRS